MDIDECPSLHIAIRAEKDTDTCLFLMVHDKEPDDHKNRFVVIGRTPKGNPGSYQVIKDCFTIRDDGEWHEYDFDLRKIRGDGGYSMFPNAGSIRIIEFYSWTGGGKHSFYFNDFICKQEQSATPPEFVVQGTIRQADGNPLSGCTVRVFDKDLRQKELLGEIVTDKAGQYKITYTAGQFTRAEKKSADVFVRVFDQEEKLLVESEVIFNAKPEVVIDLEVSRDKMRVDSEFEHVIKEIRPLVIDMHISDLREDDEDKPEAEKFRDISFLSGETGISAQHLSFLVQAAKLNIKTNIDPEIFYGLFRQNLPTELTSLLAQDIQTHRLALEKSISENIIPSSYLSELEGILQTLHALPEANVIKKPAFLVKPDLLFNDLTDLKKLDKEEAGFVGMKLNDHFRGELLKLAGAVSEAMNKSLRTAFARIDYQYFKDSDTPVILLKTILSAIKKDKTLAQEASEIEKRLSNLPSQKISDLLHLNSPLQDNPILYSEIRKAKTLEYAGMVKLSDEKASHLMDKNLFLDDSDETILDDLVNEKIIDTKQKEDLQLIINLGRLTGDNIPFAQTYYYVGDVTGHRIDGCEFL